MVYAVADLHITKCGSVDKETIEIVVAHINAHVPKTVELSRSIILLVGGHSSRKGIQWIEALEKMNIVVVRLPANKNSHDAALGPVGPVEGFSKPFEKHGMNYSRCVTRLGKYSLLLPKPD